MIAVDILLDGLFAAVAAIGFGAISDPPVRAFPCIALLAAVGHALRFCLMSMRGSTSLRLRFALPSSSVSAVFGWDGVFVVR